MLNKECTMKQYCINIQLKPIIDSDQALEDILIFYYPLSEQLNEIDGVDNADYSGHFGNCVFLNLESKFDTIETWDRIEKTIDNHINQNTKEHQTKERN